MKGLIKNIGLVALLGAPLLAEPLAAPDTGDILGSISNVAGAAVGVIVAFIAAKWGLKALRSLMK